MVVTILCALCAISTPIDSRAIETLNGRLIAVGIRGFAAVSVVGIFHSGAPIHDKSEFRVYTQPGSILDPKVTNEDRWYYWWYWAGINH